MVEGGGLDGCCGSDVAGWLDEGSSKDTESKLGKVKEIDELRKQIISKLEEELTKVRELWKPTIPSTASAIRARNYYKVRPSVSLLKSVVP